MVFRASTCFLRMQSPWFKRIDNIRCWSWLADYHLPSFFLSCCVVWKHFRNKVGGPSSILKIQCETADTLVLQKVLKLTNPEHFAIVEKARDTIKSQNKCIEESKASTLKKEVKPLPVIPQLTKVKISNVPKILMKFRVKKHHELVFYDTNHRISYTQYPLVMLEKKSFHLSVRRSWSFFLSSMMNRHCPQLTNDGWKWWEAQKKCAQFRHIDIKLITNHMCLGNEYNFKKKYASQHCHAIVPMSTHTLCIWNV